eukprot:Pgem_evm1s17966
MPNNWNISVNVGGTQPTTNLTKIKSSTDRCPRCNDRVYAAEALRSEAGIFHKKCFSCYDCKKKIEKGSEKEHEKEVYCKACYSSSYGPKGYGHGVGIGIMNNTYSESKP